MSLVITHPAVLYLAAVTETVRCSAVVYVKDGTQQVKRNANMTEGSFEFLAWIQNL